MKKYSTTKCISFLLFAVVLCLALISCGNATPTLGDDSSRVDKTSETISSEVIANEDHTDCPPITYTFNSFEEIASLRAAQQEGGAALESYIEKANTYLYNVGTTDEVEKLFDDIGNKIIPAFSEQNELKLDYMDYTPYRDLIVMSYQNLENDVMLRVIVFSNPEGHTRDQEPIATGSGKEVSFNIYDIRNNESVFAYVADVKQEDYYFTVSIVDTFPDGAEGLARVMENVHLTTILEQIGE